MSKKDVVKIYIDAEEKAIYKTLAEEEGKSLSTYLTELLKKNGEQPIIEIKTNDIMAVAQKCYEIEKMLKLINDTAVLTNSLVADDVSKIRNEFNSLEKEISEKMAKIYKTRKQIEKEAEKILKQNIK